MAERTVENRLRAELRLARQHAHTVDAERADLEAQLLRARAETLAAQASAARTNAAAAARTAALRHLEDVWRHWFVDAHAGTPHRDFILGVGADIKDVIEGATNAGEPNAEDSAWGTVWLHGKWQWITKNMSTTERELAADAVARWSAALNADDENLEAGEPEGLRWWREDA
ncbi:hypothetical protein ACFYRI_15100 [Streptomyces microflavus]|uniref:hypothetical protein n=1 Tax=Streptomyces microflavus TaxID=1919 RepID=UPI0036B9B197